MNRRRTINKPWKLGRVLGVRRNRRLRPKKVVPPREPINFKALGQSALKVGRVVGKFALIVMLIAVVVFAGHAAYGRLKASTYFSIKHLLVRGTLRASADEIIKLVQSNQGKNILTVDVATVKHVVDTYPWVKASKVHRELPNRLVIEITEQKASALLLMGHLYLVNSEGHIFKRAELAETEGLPIITGLERIDYLNDQEHARQKIIRALTAIQQYNVKPRPQLSEINIGEREEITFYLRHGQAVRLGTKITDEKLQKFDTVWTALGTDASRTRLVFLDHEVRSDRVIVRMNNRSESEGRN